MGLLGVAGGLYFTYLTFTKTAVIQCLPLSP